MNTTKPEPRAVPQPQDLNKDELLWTYSASHDPGVWELMGVETISWGLRNIHAITHWVSYYDIPDPTAQGKWEGVLCPIPVDTEEPKKEDMHEDQFWVFCSKHGPGCWSLIHIGNMNWEYRTHHGYTHRLPYRSLPLPNLVMS